MNDLETEALADCLEGLEEGKWSPEDCLQRYPEYKNELASMLKLVTGLKNASNISPRPSFQAQSRERLLATIQPRKVSSRSRRIGFPFHLASAHTAHLRRITAYGVMVLLVLVLIGTGTVYASNQALPGDVLYPVKLEVEQIQLSVIPKDAQVNMGIQLMHKRNQEIDRLIELERYNDMNPALQNLENLSGDAVQNFGNLDSQQHPDANQQGKSLDNAIENNISVLSRVYSQVPPQAQDAIGHAIDMSKKDSSNIQEKLKGHGQNNGSKNGSSGQLPIPSTTPDPSKVDKHPGNQPGQSNGNQGSNGNPGSTIAPGQGNNAGGGGGKPPHASPHSNP